MADNKKSFILYCDTLHTFEELEDEEAGKLIKHLLRYVNDLNPVAPDKLTKIAFEPIKQQLKRDLVKWVGKTERLANNGRLGGIKSGEKRKANALKSKQIEANEANASKSKQIEANEAVSVSVNVSDTVYNIYNNGLSRFLNYEFDERKVTDVPEKKYFDMVVKEMNSVWMKHKPNYSFMEEADYPALLRIAYLIGKRKNISRYEVVHIQDDVIVKSFDKISEFMSNTDDKFFRKLTIDGIAIPKNFQKIEEAMRDFAAPSKAKQLESERITPDQYYTK